MADYVLEILDGDRAGEVVPVSGAALRIGRKPGNDLVLADEKTSGVHAEVVLEGDRHVLRDLGSTNGTFLDGKRVTELVLTPGDVVTFGRLRVKFRSDGEAAAGDAGDMAMHRLDAGRVRARSGSVGLLAGLLVAGLGAAGWFWWQGQQAVDEGGAPRSRTKEPLVVAGNRLAAAVAGCESEEGWQLGIAGGTSFAAGGPAHTGAQALAARRGEGNNADFAVARTKEQVSVFAGRTLTLAAWVRTGNGGQAALRAVLAAASEQVPFSFRTGSAMAAYGDWTRVEVVVGVPLGCDRVQLEVAALLPTNESEVAVDDVAIVELAVGDAGQRPPLEAKLADGNQAGIATQTAIGTGAALAIRSVDADNPAILLHVLPDTVPAPLQGLHRADLCVLSDLGASLACTTAEHGFTLEATGVESLQFVLPADASGGLLASAADDVFGPAAPDSQFRAAAVLVGDRLTRAMFRCGEARDCKGQVGGGRFRLAIASAKVDVVLSFRAERPQAQQLLREAKRANDEGQPGEALDKLRTLATKVPMDTEILAQSGMLRGDILAAQAKTVAELQQDLEQATFFTTRGGFERVALGVDDLAQLYGEGNLADANAIAALRDAARTQLAAIDGQSKDQQRARLAVLAGAFREAQQTGLAELVQRYIDQHLGK